MNAQRFQSAYLIPPLLLLVAACFGSQEASPEPPPVTVTGTWIRGANLPFELPLVYGLLLPIPEPAGRAACRQDRFHDGARQLRLLSELGPREFEAASFPYVRQAGAYAAVAAWRAVVIAVREDSDGGGTALAWGVSTATVTASAVDCPEGDLVRFDDVNGNELPCMRADVGTVGEVVVDRLWAPPVCP
jgi:hypothetical protein